MTQYSLTERQKDMLRSIVPGLEDGTVKTEWIYVRGGDKIRGIVGLDDSGILWHEKWHDVTESDIDDFADAGFFRHKGQSNLSLRAQKIIDAVNNDFGEDEKHVVPQKVEAVFGEPSANPEFQCNVFMIMPFAEEFESIYRDYIQPTVEDMGLTIKRGDDFFSHHDIIHEIWSAISASSIVIADCTGRNPNVFYELGIAHTLGKIAVLITQDIEDIPFDVRGKRFIVYQDNSAGLKQLRDKLKEYVSKATKK